MQEDIQQLLGEWKDKAREFGRASSALSIRYDKYHYGIGLPATILTVIAGATLLTETTVPWIKILVGIVGLIAAVLVAVQTFYSFAKRSESLRAVARQLEQVRREIDILSEFLPTDRAEQEKKLREISDKMAGIIKDVPAIRRDSSFHTEQILEMAREEQVEQ